MNLFDTRRAGRRLALLAGLTLAACQGNMGSGGLAIPQMPAQGAPQGPSGSQTQSRQKVVEGAVHLKADLHEIPLPAVDGFSVVVHLGTPAPSAAPSDEPASAAPSKSPRKSASRHRPAAAPSPSDSPSPAPSPSVEPSASSSVAPSSAPSVAPSPGASAAGTAKDADKISTKTTIYPDDAPAAPTPQPSGDVETFVKRTPIVRGYVLSPADLSLYGLGAVNFTIPEDENTASRGFTIAVFEVAKRHDRLVGFDTQPAVTDRVVASSLAQTIALKKNVGYLFVLYGDEVDAPAGQGYPSPGANPFVTPVPPGYQSSPGPGGYPTRPPLGGPTPYPSPPR